MSAVRDIISQHPQVWLGFGGLMIGTVFGYLVRRTNFCTMGSISDIVSFGDYRRFRSWILAGAVALLGAQLLDAAGAVSLARSMYLAPTFNWFGNTVGGLLFGFGMVFAGGCASRNLVRVGGGDLRALLTLLVMGVFAYMTLGGLLGPLRDWLDRSTSVRLGGAKPASQGIGELLGAFLPVDPGTLNLVLAALIAGAMLKYCVASKSFRDSPTHVVAGVGVGLCVVVAWALTGLAFDELSDRPMAPAALSFVRPTADALEWLQRFTAIMAPGFGVTTVLGTILGGFLGALQSGRVQLSSFSDLGDTKRSLFGAALMGIGGVMAAGCTIGQAVSGLSTLALGSFISFAAIVAGGVLGMRRLERMLMAQMG